MKEPAEKQATWKELAIYALAVVGALYLWSISGLPAVVNAAFEVFAGWELDPLMWLGIATALMFGSIVVVTVIRERLRAR